MTIPFLRGHVPAPTAAVETQRWYSADLIDFDYYVDVDERECAEHPDARKRLSQRDRALYRERIAGRIAAAEHTPEHRRAALRQWLSARRAAEDPSLRPLLPGASFARAQRLIAIALTVCGVVLGGALASALLRYDGAHAINIAWYLFVLVGLQVALVGASLGLWIARRLKPMRQTVEDVALLARLLRPLFARVVGWLQRQRLLQMPVAVRDKAQAKVGLVRAHHALYGPAAYLPLLVPAQLFGIGFNLGAIFITLLLVWFSDLSFGWGTALDVAPHTVHQLARWIALPWSWLFGEGAGYPTLAAVEGSRILLKDPLAWSQAEHLRGWRWFLVLAVLTYGLLPRLALLGFSVWLERRVLARLPFTHRRAQEIYVRLVIPALETATAGSGIGPAMPIPAPLVPLTAPRAAPRTPESVPPPPEEAAAPQTAARDAVPDSAAAEPEPRLHPEPRTELEQRPDDRAPAPRVAAQDLGTADARPPAIAPDACVLLLHIDVADALAAADHARVRHLLQRCTGWHIAATATFGGGRAMAEQALALIEHSRWEAPPARIALIQDGSQPPIVEHLRFLRRVRAAAGEQAQVLLALVGDPDDSYNPLAPLREFDLLDWQIKIEQLGDPYLRLTVLAPADEEGA